MANRLGVILANTGTPDEATPEAVRSYLEQFLMDDRIVPMPKPLWWTILHAFILPRRSVTSAEKYRQIWTREGSPLAVAGHRLASRLEGEYRTAGLNVSVRCAMTYGSPSILSAFKELEGQGCDRFVVLPLYPQQAFSTTKAVEDHVKDALQATGLQVACDLIADYHDNSLYVSAVAEVVKAAGFNALQDRLLLAFHSIPMKDIAAGDVYGVQTRASSERIAAALEIPDAQWAVGYQCRFDKSRKWLTPTTKSIIDQWLETDASDGRGGTCRTFVVCPGFAVDCLETIFDVESQLRDHYFEKARSLGLQLDARDFVYVPCLNYSGTHVEALRSVLRGHVELRLRSFE